MPYHTFENLDVWKRGCELAVAVHQALKETREYAYRDQMVRSSLSIPSNIAEGAERGTDADFIRFLHYAKGSSGELRTQAMIAAQIGILTDDQADTICASAREISSMLQGLITSLKRKSK